MVKSVKSSLPLKKYKFLASLEGQGQIWGSGDAPLEVGSRTELYTAPVKAHGAVIKITFI